VGVRMNAGEQYQQPTKTFKILTSFLIGLIISTLATQVQAETPGQLGRLFSKPSERANLDVLRKSQQLKVITPKDQQASEDDEENEPLAVLEPITLQGYVKRSDGASTLWVNNQAVQEDSTVDNATIGRLNKSGFSSKGDSTEGVDVKMPSSGKHIRLKAGQMYEPESNQIVELQVVEKAKRLSLEESGVIDGDAEPDVSKASNQLE
jgi:hypothetical protein